MRHGARRCTCLGGPHRANTISISLVSTCHYWHVCVVLWFFRDAARPNTSVFSPCCSGVGLQFPPGFPRVSFSSNEFEIRVCSLSYVDFAFSRRATTGPAIFPIAGGLVRGHQGVSTGCGPACRTSGGPTSPPPPVQV